MPNRIVWQAQKRYSQIVTKTKGINAANATPGRLGPCQAYKGWPSGRYPYIEEKKRMAGYWYKPHFGSSGAVRYGRPDEA